MASLIQYLDGFKKTPAIFWLFHIRYVVVAEPEDLSIVFSNPNCLEKSSFYKFFKNTVGEGLFSAPINKWKKHRRLINPAFNMRLIENFFPVFNEKNTNLIKKLEKYVGINKDIDIYDIISFNALDIVCQTMLGYNLNELESEKNEFEKALSVVSIADTMRIYKPWLHPDFIFNLYAKYTGLNKSYRALHKLPERIIKQKQEEFVEKKMSPMLYKEDKKASSFLDILLQLNDEGAGFSDVDLRDEVVTMMIGGSETSALAISSLLLMLAMDHDIQEKLYTEIVTILGQDASAIQLSDVNQMIYLEQCIYEALRLFPSAAVILRQATENVELNNGFVIPKNTNIVISPFKTQRDPKIYSNAQRFNPDNFSPEEKRKRHKFSLVAFSGGPRGCIGSKYAMLSMKLTIAKIIHCFQLTTSKKYTEITMKVDLMMRSKDGYQIQFHKR